jgi:hypothetical protein
VIETEEPEEEETDPSEPEGLENPDEVIIPIETKEEKNVQKEPGGNGILKPGTTVNETTPTTAAETEAPASPITPAPTVSPSAGTTEEVTIIPLG